MNLNDFIEASGLRTFDWSERTCLHFVLAWASAAESADYIARIPPYRGINGAAKVLARAGGLQDLTSSILGRQPASGGVRGAYRGDIVLFRGETFGQLGICVGVKAAIPLQRGVGFVSMEGGIALWHVNV